MTETAAIHEIPGQIADEDTRRVLGRKAWTEVVGATPPVEFHIDETNSVSVDFGAFVAIGSALEEMRQVGQGPNIDDVRYASITSNIVGLVRFEDIKAKKPKLHRFDLPEINDKNRAKVAAGLHAFQDYFEDAYLGLTSRLQVAFATGLKYEVRRNGSSKLVDMSDRAADFAAILSYGADFTEEQRELATKDFTRKGRALLAKPGTMHKNLNIGVTVI